MVKLTHGRFQRQCFRSPLLVAVGSAALVLTTAIECAADSAEQRRSELLSRAAEAIRKGRPVEAIASWRAAWELEPNYAIACDIGMAESMFGRAREAAEFLAACLREHPALPRDAPRIEELKRELSKAQKEVGTLVITVNEPGAEVAIDGLRVGRSPLHEVYVAPGTRRITVELRGYNTEEAVVTVSAGQVLGVPIQLGKLLPAASSPPAAPQQQMPPPAIVASGPSAPTIPVVIAGTALSAIGVGLGAAFSIAAANETFTARLRESEMDWIFRGGCKTGVKHPTCTDYLRVQEARLDFNSAAAVSFIGAGVFAVSTIAYALYPRAVVKPSPRMGAVGMEIAW
jgi:hypothetical protein